MSPRHHDQVVQAQAKYKKAIKSFKIGEFSHKRIKSLASPSISYAISTPDSKSIKYEEVTKVSGTPFSSRANGNDYLNIIDQ